MTFQVKLCALLRSLMLCYEFLYIYFFDETGIPPKSNKKFFLSLPGGKYGRTIPYFPEFFSIAFHGGGIDLFWLILARNLPPYTQFSENKVPLSIKSSPCCVLRGTLGLRSVCDAHL